MDVSVQDGERNVQKQTSEMEAFISQDVNFLVLQATDAIGWTPVAPPFRRRNSSAKLTTTSSRPCTVTCCRPSLRTRRTSSLNRTLASCSAQCLDRSPDAHAAAAGPVVGRVSSSRTSYAAC
jgi:hypothetical protein